MNLDCSLLQLDGADANVSCGQVIGSCRNPAGTPAGIPPTLHHFSLPLSFTPLFSSFFLHPNCCIFHFWALINCILAGLHVVLGPSFPLGCRWYYLRMRCRPRKFSFLHICALKFWLYLHYKLLLQYPLSCAASDIIGPIGPHSLLLIFLYALFCTVVLHYMKLADNLKIHFVKQKVMSISTYVKIIYANMYAQDKIAI